MKRLTSRNPDGSVSKATGAMIEAILQRLACFEDLDLSPKEIEELRIAVTDLEAQLENVRQPEESALEKYAKKILTDAGCNEYTYGGIEAKHIMDDLKTAFPEGMQEPFTYIDVANAILSMSRPAPIKKAPYMVCWDNGHDDGEIECRSMDQAVSIAEDTLVEWVVQETATWKSDIPTPEEIDQYNYMIYNCSVEVRSYNPNTDEYELAWEPSQADEEQLGWVELGESGTPILSL